MMKKKLVVITGAGISAESGIKTFRDGDGLWENYKIEEVATPEAWKRNPELVNRFYNQRRRQIIEASPNPAHQILADLESHFDVQIITQNIDDLHERAGSSNVLHLHGEILKMRCERNELEIMEIREDITNDHLSSQGHKMRPHIVWFGESVPLIETASEIVHEADLLLIVGTSLQVYPAAGLIHETRPGTPIYLIDRSIPNFSKDLPIHCIENTASIGMKIFQQMITPLNG